MFRSGGPVGRKREPEYEYFVSRCGKEQDVSSVEIKYQEKDIPINSVSWIDRCKNVGLHANVSSGKFIIDYTIIELEWKHDQESCRTLSLGEAEIFLEAALRMVRQNQ